ncbi:MAG: hypothetical protein HS115_04575 [Spirochaetales bacterium]|nr:hypothetical protein [Spirochaetales bacterium]
MPVPGNVSIICHLSVDVLPDHSHLESVGLIYADIELINSGDIALADRGIIPSQDIRKMDCRALVDSGAYMLCINELIRHNLGLRKVAEAGFELANGTIETLDVVGPVEVIFQNRSTSCRAAVLPGESEVLLGAIPMEDLDVVLDPKRQTIEVNPESPYIAKKKLK